MQGLDESAVPLLLRIPIRIDRRRRTQRPSAGEDLTETVAQAALEEERAHVNVTSSVQDRTVEAARRELLNRAQRGQDGPIVSSHEDDRHAGRSLAAHD